MKVILIIIAVVSALFLAALGIGAWGIYSATNAKLRKPYAVTVKPVAIPATPAAVALGRHLALTRGCFECHGEDLGGKMVMDNAPMGRVAGPNLTRGAGGLAASVTDLDLVRAIRHGIGTDGHGLYLMPSTDYATFSDADMGALIAYIRSVPAVNRERVPVKLGPVARLLLASGTVKLAADEIDHVNVQPDTVVPGLTLEYGRYVANACTGCHGPNFSGGPIAAGPPDWPPAANLTPHPDARMSLWSEADFLQTLRTGKRPDGTTVNPVMPLALGQMNDTELKSVYMFLKTLTPVATGVR